MTASETVNPKEKLGGPLGRAEERHRPGSMGATSPPPPPPRFSSLGSLDQDGGGGEEGCIGRIGLETDPASRCWWKRRA